MMSCYCSLNLQMLAVQELEDLHFAKHKRSVIRRLTQSNTILYQTTVEFCSRHHHTPYRSVSKINKIPFVINIILKMRHNFLRKIFNVKIDYVICRRQTSMSNGFTPSNFTPNKIPEAKVNLRLLPV